MNLLEMGLKAQAMQVAANKAVEISKEACPSCSGSGFAEAQVASGLQVTGRCWKCRGDGVIEVIRRKA